MRPFSVETTFCLKGSITPPGDKSIAHRAIILSALAKGKVLIENFPANSDCLYTLSAFNKLGIATVRKDKNTVIITGKGLSGLKKPFRPIFVGESGTTFRLLSGVLAGQSFESRLTAAESLSKRPMLRVTSPLRLMGAVINSRGQGKEEYPPITIRGGNLKAITYNMPVASAQVKSAVLLAGLYAQGATKVIEPIPTRDHTERMLKLFGMDIKFKKNQIILNPGQKLVSPGKIYIPGDISSASFFIVLASILPKAELLIEQVNLNPLRIGVIRVLKKMGANIKVTSHKSQVTSYEPMGDLIVRNSKLNGVVVRKEEIPSLIDELPILLAAACYAKGKTVFEGAGELRVKETDRIRSMSENLAKMGADIKVIKTKNREDVVAWGVNELKGGKVKSFGDHRTAMSLIIAGLRAQGKTTIDDIDCINKSFPDFLKVLNKLLM